MYRLISTRITSTFFFLVKSSSRGEGCGCSDYAPANYNLSLSLFLYVINANKLPDRVAKLNDDPISQLSFI